MSKKIKIKRTTSIGIKKCCGEFFEANGFQYCITKFEGHLNVIELQTGFRVIKVDGACKTIDNKKVTDYLKDTVQEIPIKKLRKGIKKAQILMIGLNIPFPLNNKIAITGENRR